MPTPEELEAEKARKKAEKEARRAQFAAANPDKKTTYEKPSAKNKANNNNTKDGQEQEAATSSTNTATAAPQQQQQQQQQPAASSTATTTGTAANAEMDEAARKKAEKEARRAQFAAANPDKKTTYEKNAGAAKTTNINKQQQSASTTTTAAAPTQPSSTQKQQQPPATTTTTTTTAPPAAPVQPVKVPAYAQPEPVSHLRQLCYPTPLGLGNRTAKNPFPKFTSSSSHNTNNASPAMSNTPTPSGPSSPSLMMSSNNKASSSSSSSAKANIAESPVHPRVAALGALLSARCVVGCNARLLATLEALSAAGCSFIDDGGHDLSDMTFSLKLTEYLRTNIQFLESCRPFSSGMRQITDRILLHLPKDIKDSKVVKMLFDEHREELQESIVDTAAGTARLIQEGDIVLTYGRSSSIEMALCSLCRDPQAPNFSIIIVDAAPHFEGRALLQRLREAGATALSYCMLDAVTTATHKATKVLLGASAMLPNGQVLGRAGTALVSIAAKYTRTPVFCVCESYKFTANMWQGSSSGFRVAASASQEEEKRMNEEKMLGLDLSGCINTSSTVQQHCVGPVNYFGGTVLVANSNNNNSNNTSNVSGNPFSPVTQQQHQQHGRFIGGGAAGAGGAVQYSSTKARNAANNNSNSNKSISEEFSSVDLSYDLSPPGCVNFVVSEHEVHEPTAIAAVVSMRRG